MDSIELERVCDTGAAMKEAGVDHNLRHLLPAVRVATDACCRWRLVDVTLAHVRTQPASSGFTIAHDDDFSGRSLLRTVPSAANNTVTSYLLPLAPYFPS